MAQQKMKERQHTTQFPEEHYGQYHRESGELLPFSP